MRRLLPAIASLVSLSALVVSCDRTPDYVIPHDDMVELLVDIRTGEGVVDVNRREFGRDSMVRALKQSILMKHGVTQQQFDTSLVWYGHHLEEYLKVCDDVIARLEGKIEEMNLAGAGSSSMSVSAAGDSVDVWPGARRRLFASVYPSQFISFVIRRDDNTDPGDIYSWRMKMDNVMSRVVWTVAADYTDGTSEYITGSADGNGWNRIQFATDSIKEISRIYGSMAFAPRQGDVYYVDSIELVRTRLEDTPGARRIGYKPVGKSKG